MSAVQFAMESPVGKLFIVANEKGLCGILWDAESVPRVESLSLKSVAESIIAETVKQLTEYFEGRRTHFELPFDVRGTDFQKRVWKELSNIPYGKTCSYSDIAKRIENGGAVRAVGTANGRNPLSIVVPCHRVIASDGTLGGYAGGLHIKKKLLELELGNQELLS